MKAILLAAGFGTRLRPITNTTPKCLVPISGKPLLAYWLDIISAIGIRELLVNTHYLSDQVVSFVESYGFDGDVILSNEDELLGTGGTLVNNANFWRGHSTMIAHADNFCLSDIGKMLDFHLTRPDLDASLLVFKTNNPSQCGIVELDNENLIVDFHEKVDNPPSELASGALLFLNPRVYDKYFSSYENDFFGLDLSRDVLPRMVGNMRGWHADGIYLDIGTIENYNAINQFFKLVGRSTCGGGCNQVE